MHDYIQGHFTHKHDHKHDHKHTVMKNTITVDRDQVIANYYNMLQALAEYMEVNEAAIQADIEAKDASYEKRQLSAEDEYQAKLSEYYKHYPSAETLKEIKEGYFREVLELKALPKNWWGNYTKEVGDKLDNLQHKINEVNEKITHRRVHSASLYSHNYVPPPPLKGRACREKDIHEKLKEVISEIEKKLTIAKYHKTDVEFTDEQIIEMENRLQYGWVEKYLDSKNVPYFLIEME